MTACKFSFACWMGGATQGPVRVVSMVFSGKQPSTAEAPWLLVLGPQLD